MIQQLPLLGLYPKKTKTQSRKNICTPTFTALFSMGKTWQQLKCPLMDEWIKKMQYTYNGKLLRHKKNAILSLATTWMNFESIMLNEVSQRNTNIIDPTYGI